MKALKTVLQKLVESGLKVNAEKSFFRRTETKYLIFWISKNGFRILSSKLYLINVIDVLTKVHDV